MFRKLFALLLFTSAVLSAPQQNSNITYVKRQVDQEHTQTQLNNSERESRIEKVPLTIPGNVTKQEKDPNSTSKASDPTESAPTYNYSDRIYSISTKTKQQTTTVKTIEEDKGTEKTNTDIEEIELKELDIVPAESILNDRLTNDDSADGVTTETNLVTEVYELRTTTTEVDEVTTRAASPRFLPKLSYYEKSTFGSFSQNLIPIASKRRFRSRCRCEKIWNCAKLQISVPRCPEEYFMCCS